MSRFPGRHAFVIQRLSALVVLAGLAVGALGLAFGPAFDFTQWQIMIARPGFAAGLAVFAAAILAHAWVGVRDVVLDYIHPLSRQLAVLGIAGLALVGLGAWTLLILAAHLLNPG